MPMMDIDDCPEASGPSSEGELFGLTYGSPGMPTIGRPPRQMSAEQRDKERAQAAEQFERRQRIEAAAISISVSATEGKALADDVLKEAALAAAKAVTT
jgi:hypothetical protein